MKPRLTPARVKGLRYVRKVLGREDIQNEAMASDDLTRAAEYLQELVDWWDLKHIKRQHGRIGAWRWNQQFGVWIKDGSAELNGKAK
jgi:hypothetical protein